MEGSSTRDGRIKHGATKRRRRTTRTIEEEVVEEVVFDSPPPNYGQKHFLPGKRLIPSHLREGNLLELFSYQEWLPFMQYKNDVYKIECAIFYKNLRIRDEILESTVHGKRIVLDRPLIARLFEIDDDGEATWFDPVTWPDDLDFSECVTSLLEDNPSGLDNLVSLPSKRLLSGKMQMLMMLMDNCILTKSRKDGMFNFIMAFVMWRILSRVKLSLPFYVLRHMFYMRNRSGLPYCMHLTKIFDEFNVPRVEEEKLSFNSNWNLTLKAIRLSKIYLVDNAFISQYEYSELPSRRQKEIFETMGLLSDQRTAHDDDDDDDDSDEEDQPSLEPPRPLDNRALLLAIHSDITDIKSHLSSMDNRIDVISRRMDAMGYPSFGGQHSGGDDAGGAM